MYLLTYYSTILSLFLPFHKKKLEQTKIILIGFRQKPLRLNKKNGAEDGI